MALFITGECISCEACVSVCPNDAISARADTYVVDPASCTECVGAEDEPQCRGVCPAECIVDDPRHRETPEQLRAKYDRLHA